MTRFLTLFLLIFTLNIFAQQLDVVLQLGHQDDIKCIEPLKNERAFLTGSRDKSVILWKTDTKHQIRSFEAHDGSVLALCMAENQQTFYSGTGEGSIYQWDLLTGELLNQWQAHHRRINAIAYSKELDFIVTGGYENKVKIWKASNQELIHSIKVNPDNGTGGGVDLSISANGNLLAIGEDNKTIQLWDLQNLKQLISYKLEKEGWCGGCPTSVDFGDSNNLFIAADNGPTIQFNTKELKLEATYSSKIEDVVNLTYNNNKLLISTDETLYYIDNIKAPIIQETKVEGPLYDAILLKNTPLMAVKKEATRLPPADDTFNGLLSIEDTTKLDINKNSMWEYYLATYIERKQPLITSKNGKELIIGKQGAAISILNLETGKLSHRLFGHPKEILSLTQSPSGKQLASGDVDGNLFLWDYQTYRVIKSTKAHRSPIFSICYSKNENTFATASWDGEIKIWNANDLTLIQKITIEKASAYDIKFMLNGNYILASCLDKTIKLFEIDTQKEVKSFIGHIDNVQTIHKLSETEFLTSGWDKKTAKWDILSGLQSHKIKTTNKHHSVTTLGNFTIIGESNGNISLHHPNSSPILLKGHKKPVVTLKTIPEKQLLISVGMDGAINLWNTEEWSLLATYYKVGHLDWAIFSPTGHFDASEGAYKHIHFSHDTSTFDLDQFFNRYYQPRLLKNLLSNAPIKPLNNTQLGTLVAFPPPTVRFTTHEKKSSTVKKTTLFLLEAIDNGGGINDIKLLHNGKAIELDKKGLQRGAKKGNLLKKVVEVDLIPGINHFSLSATSKGDIESFPQKIQIIQKSQVQNATAYVITVGINNYQNHNLDLNYAKSDAEEFVKSFKNNAQGLYKDIIIYEAYNSKATKQGIIEQFQQVIDKASPQDVFIFYFAGHGSLVDGQFYFIPNDNTRLYEEKHLQEHAIKAEDLQEMLLQIKALKQVIFVDACHSGGAAETIASRGAKEEKAIAHLSRTAGVHVLAASESEQFASEFKELKHGVFTYTLLEAIAGKADGSPKDNKVTIYELKSYLDAMVPEYSEKHKGSAQYPHTFSRGSDFPLILIQE